MINAEPESSFRPPRGNARGIELLLWLAAGAAWTMVAVKAWSQTRKRDARRKTFSVSDRLLKEVFSTPQDVPS